MDRFVNKTFDVVTRLGERLERRFSVDENIDTYTRSSSSGDLFSINRLNARRPLYDERDNNRLYSLERRGSSDNLAAAPSYQGFNNYRQNSMTSMNIDGQDRDIYESRLDGRRKHRRNSNFNNTTYDYDSTYGMYPERRNMNAPYDYYPGNVGYAPNYYISERREVELVPAPQPRIIRQKVPVPVPVDRPVPQPYPVAVLTPYPVDRPVPYPVPTPVPYDRPVAVPVPVAVPSQPVYVPVSVPRPTPCYVPVPVPSSRASPVIFEQSVTHTQRWVNGSPAMINNPQHFIASSGTGVNRYVSINNNSFIR